jgi:carotenoid cleavage dioxygenase-like enzyme
VAERWHSAAQVLMKVTIPEEAGLSAPIDQAEVKTEVWAPGPQYYTQEAIFVPREAAVAEDDG